MKNSIFLLLLTILIFKTAISFAQIRIDVGVKAGISIHSSYRVSVPALKEKGY
jgi:hypothetical protein